MNNYLFIVLYSLSVLNLLNSNKSPKCNHSPFEDEETRGSDHTKDYLTTHLEKDTKPAFRHRDSDDSWSRVLCVGENIIGNTHVEIEIRLAESMLIGLTLLTFQ